MQGIFGEKHVHGIDPKGRLQLARPVREQLKLKKGDRLHLLPNVDDPPFLEVRTSAQWDEYERRFLSQAPGEVKRDFVRFVQLHRETVVADGRAEVAKADDLARRPAAHDQPVLAAGALVGTATDRAGPFARDPAQARSGTFSVHRCLSPRILKILKTPFVRILRR